MTKGLEQMTYKILAQSLPWASSTAPQETPSSPHLAWAFPLKPSPTAAALCIPLSPHSAAQLSPCWPGNFYLAGPSCTPVHNPCADPRAGKGSWLSMLTGAVRAQRDTRHNSNSSISADPGLWTQTVCLVV